MIKKINSKNTGKESLEIINSNFKEVSTKIKKIQADDKIKDSRDVINQNFKILEKRVAKIEKTLDMDNNI